MDLYKILNVEKSSSQEEIKKAYRKASLKHHPDRGGNAEEFKKINRAYEVLGDEMKRRDYNMKSSSPFFNGDVFNNDAAEMPDIFKMFFGGGPVDIGRMAGFGGPGGGINPNVHIFRNGKPVFKRQSKPPPISKTVKITLVDAYNGLKFPLEIERMIIGNHTKTEKETIYVDIYKGIDTNEIILIEGKGNINEYGIQGDIKIFIRIENHNIIQRQGLNLLVKKEIGLKDSLVGFKFDIEHLNGKTYTINNTNGKVINHGYESVIDNMGMVRDDRVGKLIVVFHVNFPKILSDEQRKKLSEIL